MTRSRVDRNQADLVLFIRQHGASFQHTHSIPGALDGIIGYRGIDVRVEFKDPEQPPSRRRLTAAEHESIDKWKGRRPVIIETEGDVVVLLAKLEALK